MNFHGVESLDVSRETLSKLESYVALLRKWNPKINLVSPDTLDQAWDRHIVDSAQLVDLMPRNAKTWVDIGSGGGFPGMIVAVILNETAPACDVTLIESDQRKSAFLRAVNRDLDLGVKVETKRIEDVTPLAADVVSARALAPLNKLLGYASRHVRTGGVALLPKGRSWKKEIPTAQSQWNFSFETHKSATAPDAVVLEIRDIVHV